MGLVGMTWRSRTVHRFVEAYRTSYKFCRRAHLVGLIVEHALPILISHFAVFTLCTYLVLRLFLRPFF